MCPPSLRRTCPSSERHDGAHEEQNEAPKACGGILRADPEPSGPRVDRRAGCRGLDAGRAMVESLRKRFVPEGLEAATVIGWTL